MKKDTARSQYAALANPARQAFLASLLYELTLAMRDILMQTQPRETTLHQMAGINELNHQLSQTIRGEIKATARYRDDVLIDILTQIAKTHGLSHYLDHSWGRALRNR